MENLEPTTPAPLDADLRLPESFLDNAGYREFVAYLLGGVAYGELSSFESLSSDAKFSPSLADRVALGRMAAAEFAHFEMVSARLSELGYAVEASMAPFVPLVDAFHERTRPGDWFESLMKHYVSEGFASDFYDEITVYLDSATRDLINHVRGDVPGGAVLVERLRNAIRANPRLSSRLALWGRRLAGETLTQVQRAVKLSHGTVVTAGEEKAIIDRLNTRHAARMQDLELKA